MWSWVVATLIVLVYSSLARAESSALAISFNAPASDWEREALPIGNGALGAMIYGGVEVERLQLNEKTLWTGGPGSRSGYDFGWPERSTEDAVDEVARTLERRGALPPEDVAKRLGRKARGYGDYQSFGELVLEMSATAGTLAGYRRELDLHQGMMRIRYEREGVRYLREYFASYPDGVIVMRLSADQPGRIGFRAKFLVGDNRTAAFTSSNGRMSVAGALHDNGLKYEAAAQVLTKGGQRADLENGAVEVTGADAAILVLSAGTGYRQSFPDYRGRDPHDAVHARVDAAVMQTYEQLLTKHTADYGGLFQRVTFDIGQAPTTAATPDLLARYGKGDGANDRALEALYFQYGRYLLIASSRAGSLPANLQGVWNQSATPPWNADYHVNINLQMNYWPAQSTNLAETALPLYDFIDSLIAPGRHAAQRVAGADGWTLFLNTNIWGFTGLIDWPTAFWQPEAGAWLAQHYYEHYRYSRDEKFLRERAWPAMKAAAQFWLDELRVDPRDGRLVVTPSFSPEHGPFAAGAAMSQQIVFDLFTNVLEAAPVVGEDLFAAQVQASLRRLDPGLRIGSWGQLQEWKDDRDDRTNEHRHVSHLFALHPGHQISIQRMPELAAAARRSLEARGDGGTGWSMAWKINFWARLLDGDRAHALLGEQLRKSTLPNLFDTHPPFQIDGNFGATAGIAEMLLQSHDGEIHVLPALPSAWAKGAISGLRARGGGITVDVHWSDQQAEEITLRATHSGPVRVRSSLFARDFSASTDDGTPSEASGAGEVRTFHLRAGHSLTLRRRRP